MTKRGPLRIQFFTHYCQPAGTYFRFHNLAIGLSRLGHSVVVFAGDTDPRRNRRTEARDGVIYHISPTWPGARLFGTTSHPMSALSRAMRSYPPADVVHLFQPFLSGAAAWYIASRSAGATCFDWDDLWTSGLFGGHAWWQQPWARYWVSRLERSLPAVAGQVTVASPLLARLAAERGGSRVKLIRNGLWPTAVPAKRDARRRLGLHDGAHYVGFMGFTVAELPWCFEALALTAEQHPALRMALCGPPVSVLSKLERRVRDRIDHVGLLPPEKIPCFAAALDLALLPLEDTEYNRSRYPIKFAEYLAGGAPVLLSAVGEIASVAAGMPWILWAGTDRASWLAAFAKAVVAMEERRLPAVDSDAVSHAISWDRFSAELAETYRELLDSGAARRRR